MPTSSSFDRLAEAVRLCEACPLGTMGRGVPGKWADGALSMPGGEVVMILGEAPGGVEMAKGEPFVGGSGQLLHSLLKEMGLTSYYVSNIAKHRPWVVKGKQQAPDKVAVEACAPFLRAEFELVKPTKLILLGKTAAKMVCKSNFSMKDVVNTTHEYHRTRTACETCRGQGAVLVNPPNDCDFVPCPTCGVDESIPTLVLYHPAHFLYNRTAPWIQKQVSEWKRSVRMFLGDRPPEYQIERVTCETHD